ncbi:MAG: Ig-like domain-containing protein [Flammeovirgaceae bacterium]
MKRFHIYSYILLLLVALSCDQLQSDELPDDDGIPITTNDVVYGMPGSPILIDLLANDVVLHDATFEIIEQPSSGMAQITESGQCMYRSNLGANVSIDRFKYRITTASNASSIGEIEVRLESDSSNIPCEYLNLMSDFVHITDPNELYGPIAIDVLANDAFCAGTWDANSLAIAFNPLAGTAFVDSGWVIYEAQQAAIDPSQPFLDFFIYSVDRTDSDEQGYALVLIEFCPDSIGDTTDVCLPVVPEAVEDHQEYIEVGVEACINVLANDTYCEADIDLSSLHVSSPAFFGTTVVGDDGVICYTANQNFNGYDCYSYEFCTTGGDCYSAIVHQYGDTAVVCNVTTNAQDDYLDSITPNGACIDVLANDYYCGDQILWNSFTILRAPSYGEAFMSNNWACYAPNPNFTGQDEFEYHFCLTDGSCYQATVYVSGNPDTTTCSPVPTHDEYVFSWSAVDDWALSTTALDSLEDEFDSLGITLGANEYVVELDVMANDVTCTTCDILEITYQNSGRFIAIPSLGRIYFIVADGTIGTDEATYNICNPANWSCNQANIFINLTQ